MCYITKTCIILACLIVILSFSECCSTDKERCSSSDHIGGRPNDPYLHICGNRQYNISEGLCCNEELFCGLSKWVADCCKSKAYNPLNEICCNGQILNKTHISEKCCGSETYLETTHACCVNKTVYSNCSKSPFNSHGADGNENTFRRTEAKELFTNTSVSKCGSSSYDPLTQMCCSDKIYKLSALYKCCGAKTYDISEKLLCCNGIIYEDLPENSQCVGGFIYTEKQTIMICGSKVYKTTKVGRNAECCGRLLVGKNQTCCSSSSHAMLYENKLDHHCCGHQYYNKALWSCCAGDLRPTPNKHSPADFRLKPLTDLIPIMCNKTVVFGKVESVALQNHVNRTVCLSVMREVCLHHCKTFRLVSLDHCSSPALEIGKTYLWETNRNEFKPLSLPIGQASEIHMFLTLCNKVNETICGV